jgi:sugar (pentulose or hexulose) kinase
VGSLVLAIDIGTSLVKASVLSAEGIRHGQGLVPQRVLSPHSGWSEHDPSETWRAVVRATRTALDTSAHGPTKVQAIVVTGPRGTVGLLGEGSAPLTRMLTWRDKRATGLAGLASETIDPATYYAVAGTPLDPAAALLRLLWFRRRASDLWLRTRRLATPQGLVLIQLGADASYADWSTAAMVGLLDISTRQWSPTLLGAFDLSADLMPSLAAPGKVVGRLSDTAASELGLASGIPLVLAAADGVCGELGSGVTEPTHSWAYLGTSIAVSAPLAGPRMDPQGQLIVMPGAAPDTWRVSALGLAGGSALDWFAATNGRCGHDALERTVAQSPPGANGVQFLPALTGEGAPFWRPHTRGAFIGLSLTTTQSDMTRAILEGVAIEMRLMVDALRRYGLTPTELNLTGGCSSSPSWCEIVANATAVPINRVLDPCASLRGAACYGLLALGDFSSVAEASHALASPFKRIDPDPSQLRLYSDAAEVQLLLRARLGDETFAKRLSPDDDGLQELTP